MEASESVEAGVFGAGFLEVSFKSFDSVRKKGTEVVKKRLKTE